MTSTFPDEPGIDSDRTEESPLPDRDTDDDRHGIESNADDDEATIGDYGA